MTVFPNNPTERRPLIGCTTYRKMADQFPQIEIIGLMPAYIRAVEAAGGVPLLIPLGVDEVTLAAILERVDGVLLPGGGDIDPVVYQGNAHKALWGIDKDRDRVEFFVAQQAVKMAKPVLAICRGHQVMNVALGGTLWEDIGSLKSDAIRHDYFRAFPRNHIAHSVDVTPDSKLASCFCEAELMVNSLHHQGVRDLAPELMATAVAPDGLIEAVEISDHPFAVGVQWHPENLIQNVPEMLNLFTGLIDAASVKK
ncbi:MAG: gamma-glutamyl-gamma-aminobutyrate hydrolase family protein [Chloroflexi bacterium]|nr:gamma-glutamyl-gamma-aminobutyrate hydrolase family protein [Chloroflexota bacterium]